MVKQQFGFFERLPPFLHSEKVFLTTVFYFVLLGNCTNHVAGDGQFASKTRLNYPENLFTCAVGMATNNALIPYNNNGILSQFYKTNKTFVIPQLKKQILIKQDWNNNGVAGVVWEAAFVLSEYITRNIPMQEKKVLELGAGTGLVGMVAMALGAEVTFTDIHKALPLLQENVDMNFVAEDFTSSTYIKPEVRKLEWGQNLEKFSKCSYDYILGADIIYREDTFDALLETLCYLTSCKYNKNLAKILLSSKLRYDRVNVFVAKLKKKFSTVHQVHEESTTNVVIYECF